MPIDSSSFARLLSLAAHELRTPLGVVRGYLRMLQRDAEPLAARHRAMIDDAEKACARLMAIVGELGEVGRLDAGLTAARTEDLDLFALVQEVADAADEARDRGVRLEVRGESARAWTRGDRLQIGAAFASFFRAVLREQPDDTLVVVERQLLPGAALVVVAREAEAGAASLQPAAPFDETRGGLGLALPIARRIVEHHRGRVWSPAGPDGHASVRSAILISLPVSEPST